ncbi:eCIS core domain-containing protein [Streptomyces sp. Ncost-T6T-1]|uniref:eCIS core domain-containing protein n=1 Tax=Streptomyces sp. Ncost-T6T-1 TaxID=1100828 RepID=UPI00406D1419
MQRSTVQNVLRAPGRPLDAALKDDMESRFDADFSDVRLHTGAAARDSAAEIGARAYTSGSHIVIGDGGDDQHTLAHELTHVIQQRTGPVSGADDGTGLRISDPSDRYEREAEANASRVLSGPPAHSPAEGAAGHGPASHDTGAATVQRRPREKPAEEEGDHTHVDPDYPGLRLTVDQALTAEYYETIFKLGGSEERVIFDSDGSFGYIKVDDELRTYYSLVSGEIGAQQAQANLSGHFSPQRASSYHVRANGKQFQDARIDSLQDFEAAGIGPGQLVEVSVALLSQASGRAETVAGGLVESRLDNATTGMRNSAALDPIKIRVTSSGISISDGNHRLAAAAREGHAYAPCMIV